jgi:hypothetical protein
VAAVERLPGVGERALSVVALEAVRRQGHDINLLLM